MAREFAQAFYNSTAWKRCREAYKHKRSYLCENCLRRGIYKAGEIVHHKIELDPVNINNPEVTLNFDNLELLCRDCHAEVHGNVGGQFAKINAQRRAAKNNKNRYVIRDDGRVFAR